MGKIVWMLEHNSQKPPIYEIGYSENGKVEEIHMYGACRQGRGFVLGHIKFGREVEIFNCEKVQTLEEACGRLYIKADSKATKLSEKYRAKIEVL